MKRSLVIFTGLLSLLTAFSGRAANPVVLTSKVSSVKVYQGSAMVTRTASVSLESGLNKLVFGGLSSLINSNSITVSSVPGVSLVSVTLLNQEHGKIIKPESILETEDSLTHVFDMIETLEARLNGLTKEKELMDANKQITGTTTVLHADDLEESMALYRKRFQEIHEEIYRIQKNVKPLLAIRDELKKVIDDFINRNKMQRQIMIQVQAANSGNAELEFSYITANCNWTPEYDIRIADMKTPMKLISKAAITQQTGEDWENVKLILSSADPANTGSKQELSPNWIQFEENRPQMMMKSAFMDREATPMSAGANAVIQQLETHMQFKLTQPYSVPSDGAPHQVELNTTDIPAAYAYGTVPKLDPTVYATARIPALDLPQQMPGMASVYFNDTYTGQTWLEPSTSDSMLISLGKDTRLRVERNLLKELSSRSCFGGKVTDQRKYQISIRNSRKETIEVLIEDQIPVSQISDIEVKLIDAGNAAYDAATGKLTWILKLEPESSRNLEFTFEVKYPKDKRVSAY